MATVDTPRRSGAGGQSAPRSRKGRPKKPRHRGFWYYLCYFLNAVGVVILVGILASTGLVVWILKNTPNTPPGFATPKGRTQILSEDGVMLARLYTENRVVVPLEKIPKNLQNATIAFEDKRFYQHGGIDAEGIARSIWSNLRNHELLGQGGSTLEQQLVRNMGVEGLTTQKSISRKVHEWIAAVQLERTRSKQEILEMYLNEVNYGSGCWGVEAASEAYFGKHVQDLDLAQCALLAGLPNRPTYYNPYYHKDLAMQQRNRVLDQMLEQGYISDVQYDQAINEPITLISSKPPSAGSQIYSAPYFVNYVIDQLKREYGEDEIDQGNLRVYTSLNFKMQQIAEQVVRNHIDPNNQDGPTEAALVAIDPKTGEIKAMVGGLDYKKTQFNLATQATRQPGSLMKVVVYAAAIDSGLVNRDTRVIDAPVTFRTGGQVYSPKDDNHPLDIGVSLITAFSQSINIPAVKVLNMMGPETAVRYGHVMGINSPLDPVLSLALGSSPVTPLEMTDVYATVANGGNHPEPMAIVRLTDTNDNTIEDVQPDIDQNVLAPATVAFLNDMARATMTSGTAYSANDIPDAHGKTGTTQDHKDVWFIGYTSDIVVGVWAGHPVHNRNGQNSYGLPMSRAYWGNTVAVPIWHDFMLKAIPIIQAEKAKAAALSAPAPTTTPASATTTTGSTGTTNKSDAGKATTASDDSSDDSTVVVNVDNDSGLLAPDGAPNSHMETFAKGAAPTQMSPQYVTKEASPPAASTDPNVDNSDDNGVVQQPPASTNPGAPGPTSPPAASVAPTVTQPQAPAQAPVAPRAAAPRPAVAAPAPPPPAPRPALAPRVVEEPKKPATVTVLINPEDNQLATQWDPVTVFRTYTRGTEPKKYSKMYGPPPGEH